MENKKFFFFLFQFFFINSIITPPKFPNNGYLGTGIDILYLTNDISDTKQYKSSILSLTYNKGKTTDDGRYSIPDGTEGRLIPTCEFNSKTVRISSTYDYQKETSINFDINGKFSVVDFGFSSSLSVNYNEVERYTIKDSSYLYYCYADCQTYQIFFDNYINHSLTENFINAVNQLPPNLNDQTLYNYFIFIKNFGQLVEVNVNMGGRVAKKIIISTYSFLHLISNNIEVDEQASISFGFSIGESSKDKINTKEFQEFSKNSTIYGTYYMGGNPYINQTFSDWSKTVPENPLPIYSELVPIVNFLNKQYFPYDLNIQKKAKSLKSAINLYLQNNGKKPIQYQSDAVGIGIRSHHIVLQHYLNHTLPKIVQIFFTNSPDNNYTKGFYPCITSHTINNDIINNPISIMVNETSVDISIFTNMQSNTELFGIYDSATNSWVYHNDEGFWTNTISLAKPNYESEWIQQSTTSTLTLLKNLPMNKIGFLQIWFTEDGSSPNTAFPLLSRYNSKEQLNPATISLENGNLNLYFVNSPFIFSMYNIDPPQSWKKFKTGFFKAVFYTSPDNANNSFFDSNWQQTQENTFSIFMQHNFKKVPELIQVFFTPDKNSNIYYPIDFSTTSNSPFTIKLDENNIILNLKPINHFIFSSYIPSKKKWQFYKTGYWRAIAWKNISLLGK